MKRAAVLVVALLLIAAPVAAADVYRSPFIPTPLPTPTAGTVVVSTSVFDGLTWATDQTLIIAGPTLSVTCGERPADGA